MIDKERIKAEAEAFFEWPSKDKTHVTTTSMLIFANVIAEMTRTDERKACAALCMTFDDTHEANRGHGPVMCADAIRLRSNAKLPSA